MLLKRVADLLPEHLAVSAHSVIVSNVVCSLEWHQSRLGEHLCVEPQTLKIVVLTAPKSI